MHAHARTLAPVPALTPTLTLTRYDRWREAEPQTVQALEKLTAAVVRGLVRLRARVSPAPTLNRTLSLS